MLTFICFRRHEFWLTNGSIIMMCDSDVTSYDYDALLTETEGSHRNTMRSAGDRQYAGIPKVLEAHRDKRKITEPLKVSKRSRLFEIFKNIARPVDSVYPQSMEKLGQGYGYILTMKAS